MLELSFTYGILPHELEARLPHRDLLMLEAYAADHLLPARRQQLALAHISLYSAHAAGVKEPKLRDYLFEPEIVPADDDPAKMAANALGFAPRFTRKRKAA